jgi:hypothetical protein
MLKITNTETIVLVSYSIPPLPACFENSLYQHMFDNVYGDSSEVEEDILVICSFIDETKFITEIRYQFGSNFCEERADYVGELISDQLEVWHVKNRIDEFQFA